MTKFVLCENDYGAAADTSQNWLAELSPPKMEALRIVEEPHDLTPIQYTPLGTGRRRARRAIVVPQA